MQRATTATSASTSTMVGVERAPRGNDASTQRTAPTNAPLRTRADEPRL
jgi:hypothetical protein